MDDNRKTYQRQYRETYKAQAKRVNLTLSKSEYRDFTRAANTDNTKITSFIKELALAGLENRAHIPDELQEELKTLRFAVHNIANNVNQIAHHSNMVKNMTLSDENNLLHYLKQLDEVIRSYTSGTILSNSNNDDN
ncbi:MAG: plasmid mobilization relaxosome protein MobC [Gammaproteobacteria bacterium]|nr:plasmid mobilization relaxosome protein MobC [Gammaproteobacteria bacterium]